MVGAVFFMAGSPPSNASPPAQTFKISTWNMDWLLSTPAQNAPDVPPDIPHRSADDLSALATYAQRLRSDLIGLQEVGDSTTLGRLFNPQDYQILLSNDAIAQHTALAVRRGLTIQRNPDVSTLAPDPTAAHHPLRSGLDINVRIGRMTLRVLVVHLKTGCWDNPVSETRYACPILFQQFHALRDWLAERAKNGEPFAIIGDFNRRMTRTDPLFISLNQVTPLLLTTAGRASPCLNGSYFIDHILLGGAAQKWADPNSLRVMTIPQNSTRVLSDHCPVSITLHVPQDAPP